MMDTAVVSVKGQLLIPVSLRRKVGIKKGTRVFLEEKNGDIIVHPVTPDFYERNFGILKGGGLLKLLKEDRRKEKDDEDRRIAGR